ncbi:MAG: NAD-dependent succinate-semialdehyde dehydrogenase [Planctomycetaceae bacterium]|nr:NAD-dependent succinate-semialdehyde dehydrogenase [Planctomycetaceae bacterium]
MLTSPRLSTIQGFIGGRWDAGTSGQTFAVRNPATGDLLAQVPAFSAADTQRAVAAANAAQQNTLPLQRRAEILRQLADLITEHRAELGRIITLEHGKPWPEAQTEADYAASFFRFYSGAVSHLQPRILEERPRNHRWQVRYRPAGVAALISPWNFPLAMAAKKLSAALAADCSCVVRPSSRAPLSMMALFHLMQRLDLPDGKVNLVVGPAGEISSVLCEHPDVRVISFTGSTAVGRDLSIAAAPHLKRLSLELGGNAPFIVFPDADVTAALDHLVANKFRGAGQTCVCANRVYVHRDIAERFTAALSERADALKLGNGMDEGVDIGPLIDRRAFEKVAACVRDAEAQGAVRKTQRTATAPTSDHGCYFPPTVLCGVTDRMSCAGEEIFGPVVPVIAFSDEAEVVRAANATEYGLAAYLFTANSDLAERMIAQLHFGHVGWNSGTGPTAEAPFGGMKASGYGREGGTEGLHDFIDTQTIPCPER